MNKKVILYILIALVILMILIFTFFPGIIQAIKDSGKPASEKCTKEPGYTEQEWKEHMGHHPNIYRECLS